MPIGYRSPTQQGEIPQAPNDPWSEDIEEYYDKEMWKYERSMETLKALGRHIAPKAAAKEFAQTRDATLWGNYAQMAIADYLKEYDDDGDD